MAIDPITGSILGGAATSAIGNLFNIGSARKANKRMIEFWRMQNDYNHPRSQMQRLQEAGLNPNLVYGEGVKGATGQAGDIGTPERAQFQSPDISAFQNLSKSKAQTDLTQQQTNHEFMKSVLTGEKTHLTGQQGRRANQIITQSEDLFKHQLQAQKLNVSNMEQEVLGKQLDNDFKNQALKDRVRQVYWQAQNAKQTYTGKGLNNQLLKLQTQFLNLGLDRNSPWYAKIFGNIVNKVNR